MEKMRFVGQLFSWRRCQGTYAKSLESQGCVLGSGEDPLLRLGLPRGKICVPAAVGVSLRAVVQELSAVSAVARAVSAEQPSHAQPHTREVKKRDDISGTAVLR